MLDRGQARSLALSQARQGGFGGGEAGEVGQDALAVDVNHGGGQVFAHSHDECAAVLQLVHALDEALAVRPAQYLCLRHAVGNETGLRS